MFFSSFPPSLFPFLPVCQAFPHPSSRMSAIVNGLLLVCSLAAIPCTARAQVAGHPQDAGHAPQVRSAVVAGTAALQRQKIQEAPATSGKVIITVRTIEAQGRIEDHETTGPIPVRIDGRLGDLADKLKKLPFRGFVLLSADQRTVPVRKREYVALVNGQSLSLRPLYSEGAPGGPKKIGLWLRWQDRTGAAILDTRMHFDDGQSMIAGTDQARDPSNGIILAVQVAPVPAEAAVH